MPDHPGMSSTPNPTAPGGAVEDARPRTTQRVGVNLQYLKPQLEEMVRRNRPTRSEVEVIDIGDRMLMRVNLFGWHPRRAGEYICVVGYGDRHWRAVAAAEQAWLDLHAEIFIDELVDAASRQDDDAGSPRSV
jgi:hypothetical protein